MFVLAIFSCLLASFVSTTQPVARYCVLQIETKSVQQALKI